MRTLQAFALVTLLLASASLSVQGFSEEPAAAYQVDGIHTSAIFKVKHLGVSYFYGRFNEVSGSFTVDAPNTAKSSFDIQIKTESVDTHDEGRDRHLRSPDFFNAKQYPTLSFKSTGVKVVGSNSYEVSGNLTIHGVTKPLTVKMEHTGSGPGMKGEQRWGFETQFVIKRSEFDMNFMLDKLGDEITVIFSVEGIKQ